MKQATITAFVMLFLCAGFSSQAQNTKMKSETADGKMKMKQDKMKMKGDMGMQQVDLPYTATYSSQFTMGKPAQAKMILDGYHAYEANDLSNMDAFADTVLAQFPDGHVAKGRDAVIDAFKQQRASVSDIKFTINAVMPVHSVDRNADWVCIWYTVAATPNGGATVTTEEQSIWNINKDGKIAFIQFFDGKPMMQQ